MANVFDHRGDGHIDEVGSSTAEARRSRLRAIAEEYTEEIYDSRAAQQLEGIEAVCQFAAVTSPGSVDSEEARRGNLLVADSAEALVELLREECGEGWLAHGRAWDLDAAWHLWGNLSVSYWVTIGRHPAPIQSADRTQSSCPTSRGA